MFPLNSNQKDLTAVQAPKDSRNFRQKLSFRPCRSLAPGPLFGGLGSGSSSWPLSIFFVYCKDFMGSYCTQIRAVCMMFDCLVRVVLSMYSAICTFETMPGSHRNTRNIYFTKSRKSQHQLSLGTLRIPFVFTKNLGGTASLLHLYKQQTEKPGAPLSPYR